MRNLPAFLPVFLSVGTYVRTYVPMYVCTFAEFWLNCETYVPEIYCLWK
jgi:hypothetical protein